MKLNCLVTNLTAPFFIKLSLFKLNQICDNYHEIFYSNQTNHENKISLKMTLLCLIIIEIIGRHVEELFKRFDNLQRIKDRTNCQINVRNKNSRIGSPCINEPR